MKLTQLRGMVWYEFKLHWRRRALLVLMLTLITLNLFVVAISTIEEFKMVTESDVDSATMSAEERRDFMIQFMNWGYLAVVVTLVLPLVIADTIPQDRQLGAYELIQSLPIAPEIYLIGKVLGAYLATITSVLPIMLLSSVFAYWQYGAYDILGYASIWLMGVLPLIILNGGMGVLLPATQPNRRRAILLMIAAMFVLPIVLGANMNPPLNTFDYLSLLRAPIMLHYGVIDRPARELWLGIGVGLAELMIVAAAISGWLRWRAKTV